jgi:DNA-binding NarL/FixJ family response regulator
MLRTDPREPPATPVVVAIAEDHPDLRAGLSALLKREPGFACLGAVGTEAELSWLLVGADPDVVVLDTVFGDTDGLAMCFELKQGPRPPAILLYSARADEAFAAAAAVAGADGIVPKNAKADVLLDAIGAAAAGRLEPLVADSETIEAG